MRRSVVFILMITILVSFPCLAGGIEATMTPWEFTLSFNAGFPTSWTQVEFEFKNGPWAGGVSAGLGTLALGTITIYSELDVFARYYLPLGSGFNIYIAGSPLLIIDFFGDMTSLGIKAGPGLDFRWKHLRVALEGGFQYYKVKQPLEPLYFYVQGGLGVLF